VHDMGSASTMAASWGEGMALPQCNDPRRRCTRRRIAHESGRLIVQMARNDVRLSKILTRSAFENAIRLLSAIGGSTNAVIHLLAFAGRLGIPLELAGSIGCRRKCRCWWICSPRKIPDGDLHYRGGLPAVLKSCRPCST